MQQDNSGTYSGLGRITAAPDGAHLYAFTTSSSPGVQLDYSQDNGLHWKAASNAGAYGGQVIATSDPAVLYGLFEERYPLVSGNDVDTSTDGGATWQPVTSPTAPFPALSGDNGTNVGTVTSIAATPLTPTTVYAVIAPSRASDGTGEPAAASSVDGGQTWTQAMFPRTAASIDSFVVGTDPHLGPVLVGSDPQTDQRYLSADGGRTWTAHLCAGDHAGACPSFTLDNVFGAGASYAFLPDGIYRFHGAGPAEARIPQSDLLPVSPDAVVDVTGGTHAGDPIYVLTAGTYNNQVSGMVWRSIDAGRSWQHLAVGSNGPPNFRPAADPAPCLWPPASIVWRRPLWQPIVTWGQLSSGIRSLRRTIPDRVSTVRISSGCAWRCEGVRS